MKGVFLMDDRFYRYEQEAWVQDGEDFHTYHLLPGGKRERMLDAYTCAEISARGIRICEKEAWLIASKKTESQRIRFINRVWRMRHLNRKPLLDSVNCTTGPPPDPRIDWQLLAKLFYPV